MARVKSRTLDTETRRADDTSTPGTYVVTMSEIDVDVCWRLIASAGFGRVAFVHDGDPWVLPVNCAVSDGHVVFRTAVDSMLYGQRECRHVTFEADGIERAAESGWSVLVRGHLVELTDGEELSHLADTELHPWAPGVRDRWMKIVPFDVSGRVIARGFHADDDRRVPYMLPD